MIRHKRPSEANEVGSGAAAAALKSKRSPTTCVSTDHSAPAISQYRRPVRSIVTFFCLESQNVTQHIRSLDDEGPRLYGERWNALKKTPHLCKPQRMVVAECGSNSPSFVKGPA